MSAVVISLTVPILITEKLIFFPRFVKHCTPALPSPVWVTASLLILFHVLNEQEVKEKNSPQHYKSKRDLRICPQGSWDLIQYAKWIIPQMGLMDPHTITSRDD